MAKGRRKYISPSIKQEKTVKHPEYRTLDVYQGGHTIEELQEIRRVLAKQANQRIVRLERAESKITGEKFNTFGAVTDVYAYLDNRGRNRFSEAKSWNGMNRNELQHEIVVLQGFLGRASSTVKGMRAIEKKRLKSFEAKGINFGSTREFYDFINSETFHALVTAGFTSEQIIEAYDIARTKENNDEVIKKIDEALDRFRSGEAKVNLKNLELSLNITLIKRK